jgi:glutaredoxin
MFFFKRKKCGTGGEAAGQRSHLPEGGSSMIDVPVKLFALSTCGHCRNTRKLLDNNNVPYECVEVDHTRGEEREAVVAEVKKYNPHVSFPTLVIGDKVIVGFRENEIKEALGL